MQGVQYITLGEKYKPEQKNTEGPFKYFLGFYHLDVAPDRYVFYYLVKLNVYEEAGKCQVVA